MNLKGPMCNILLDIDIYTGKIWHTAHKHMNKSLNRLKKS